MKLTWHRIVLRKCPGHKITQLPKYSVLSWVKPYEKLVTPRA